jgi:hypothetical protein
MLCSSIACHRYLFTPALLQIYLTCITILLFTFYQLMAELHENWGYVEEPRCSACHNQGRVNYSHNSCSAGCNNGKAQPTPCSACRSKGWFLSLKKWIGHCDSCNKTRKERIDCKTCNGGELVESRSVPCRACSRGRGIRDKEGDPSGHNIWDEPKFSVRFLKS